MYSSNTFTTTYVLILIKYLDYYKNIRTCKGYLFFSPSLRMLTLQSNGCTIFADGYRYMQLRVDIASNLYERN